MFHIIQEILPLLSSTTVISTIVGCFISLLPSYITDKGMGVKRKIMFQLFNYRACARSVAGSQRIMRLWE